MAKVPNVERNLKKRSVAVGNKIQNGQVKDNFLQHIEFLVDDDGN